MIVQPLQLSEVAKLRRNRTSEMILDEGPARVTMI